MPRRPRPQHRRPPKTAVEQAPAVGKDVQKVSLKRKRVEVEEESDGEFFEPADRDDDDDEEEEEESDGELEEEDAGVAVYEDDEMGDLIESDDEEEEDDGEDDVERELKGLQTGLSTLPLGLLAKARDTLAQSDDPPSDSALDSSDSGSEPEEAPSTVPNGTAKPKKEKQSIEHRPNKHAPMEITSKRPVKRFKPLENIPHIERRDPRFTDLSGPLSLPHIQKNYAFLSSLQSSEVSTLRESLKLARKRLSSAPRVSRTAAEEEVGRLERALKRAESVLQSSRRSTEEASVLRSLKKTEMEKRKQGKGEWHMKRGEQRRVLLEARFERVREEAGPKGVKKVMERRKRREGQREKKARPFPKERPKGPGGEGRARDGGWAGRREGAGGGKAQRDGRPPKRQRVS